MCIIALPQPVERLAGVNFQQLSAPLQGRDLNKNLQIPVDYLTMSSSVTTRDSLSEQNTEGCGGRATIFYFL